MYVHVYVCACVYIYIYIYISNSERGHLLDIAMQEVRLQMLNPQSLSERDRVARACTHPMRPKGMEQLRADTLKCETCGELKKQLRRPNERD